MLCYFQLGGVNGVGATLLNICGPLVFTLSHMCTLRRYSIELFWQ